MVMQGRERGGQSLQAIKNSAPVPRERTFQRQGQTGDLELVFQNSQA